MKTTQKVNMPLNTTLITGASSGIGKAFAYEFAQNGHDLVLVARNKTELEKIRKDIEAIYKVNVCIISRDLTEKEAPKQLFDYCKSQKINVEILINNAGIGYYGAFHDASIESQVELLNLNMNALVVLTHYFLKDMKENNRGAILNVSSLAAFQPGPYMACYFASKSFVLSFSEGISRELKSKNITVTALCPGPTNSNFGENAGFISNGSFSNSSMSAEKVAKYGYRQLMKRKVVAIPGFTNKLLAFSTRLLPKSWIRILSEKVIEKF